MSAINSIDFNLANKILTEASAELTTGYQGLKNYPECLSTTEEMYSISSWLLKHYKNLEHLKDTAPAAVFRDVNFQCLGNCQSLLKKIRKRLALAYVQNIDSKAAYIFYENLGQAWKKETHAQIDPLSFGQKHLKHHICDPLISKVIYEDSVLNVPNMAAANLESSYIEKPIYHQEISEKEFDEIESCKKWSGEKKFYQKIKEVCKRLTHQELKDPQRLLAQNIKHPIVVHAIKELHQEHVLLQLKQAFKENGPDAFLKIYRDLTTQELQLIHHSIGSIKMAEELESFKNPEEQGKKIIENYLETQIIDPIIDLAIDSVIVKPITFNGKLEIGDLNESKLFHSITSIIPDLEISPELQKNLDLAYEALVYSIHTIPISTNYFDLPNTGLSEKNYPYPFLGEIDRNLKFCRSKIIAEKQKALKIDPPNNNFSERFGYAKAAHMYPLGNCGELAAVAFFYLLDEKLFSKPVEIFQFERTNGDHHFVVIGRKHDSDPNDPAKWGEEAVICDPWSRRIYPASLFAKCLQDCGGSKVGVPILKNYDPQKHILEVYAGDMMTSKEFVIKSSFSKKQEIVDLLNSLHLADSRETQEEIANQILDLPYINSDAWERDPALSLLIAQLRYFVSKSLSLK